ncbi:MAG: MerR family DNA-binding protein [Halofilum sp. (in: g-proteobacteria)]|nr:MerR family DNA-binding protein [Halofilum sp. (in: g-proteobacteria)]
MSTTAELTIGQLAGQAGLHVQTLRYYEGEGLLVPSARTPGGQRRYSAADARRLHFIRHAREFGFPVDRIRELLALAGEGERPCAEIDAIARRHRDEVRRRIRLLRELEAELDRMVSECAGGRVTDCRVLEVLGDHELCRADHGHSEEGGHEASRA